MKNQIDQIINTFVEKLENINYAFIGSTNLYIQGLEVQPKDIDILTTKDDIKSIDKILEQYRTKEIYFDESGGRNSFRSFYKIDGMEIEVLGNVNNLYRKIDSLDRKILIDFGKIKLPCMPLSEELDVYVKMGREEKVKIIQEFIRK